MPRKVSRCPWELDQIIKKTATKINIHDIEYIIRYGCEDVDSFSSGVFLVNIKGNRDGQKIKKGIIIRWHLDQHQRSYFREFYKRDYLFNTIIVPKLLDIQKTFKVIEGLKIRFLNCIHASIDRDEEVLVYASLQVGYNLFYRNNRLRLDHAILTMKNLAKLHALSFTWKLLHPTEFKEIEDILSNNVQYSDLDKITNAIKYYYDHSVNAVINPEYKKRLKDIAPHLLTILKSVASPARFSTICHGDCWGNNIAFKHQGSRPVEVMFVDHQLSRHTSPVADISYFLYMSAERELLFDHRETLLRTYHGTLAGVLRQCNLQVENVYPIDIFRQQLIKYSVLGLIEALVSMKIITADCEDAMKMAEMKHNQPDVYVEEYESKNQNIFIDRVNVVVNTFFRCDYSLTDIINTHSNTPNWPLEAEQRENMNA